MGYHFDLMDKQRGHPCHLKICFLFIINTIHDVMIINIPETSIQIRYGIPTSQSLHYSTTLTLSKKYNKSTFNPNDIRCVCGWLCVCAWCDGMCALNMSHVSQFRSRLDIPSSNLSALFLPWLCANTNTNTNTARRYQTSRPNPSVRWLYMRLYPQWFLPCELLMIIMPRPFRDRSGGPTTSHI